MHGRRRRLRFLTTLGGLLLLLLLLSPQLLASATSPEHQCLAIESLGGSCSPPTLWIRATDETLTPELFPSAPDVDYWSQFTSLVFEGSSELTILPSAEILSLFPDGLGLSFRRTKLSNLTPAAAWPPGKVSTLELESTAITSGSLRNGELQNLRGLSSISLSGTDLSGGLPADLFQGTSDLSSVDLSNCRLPGLPLGLFNSSSGSLSRLTLRTNRLTELHEDAFAELPRLLTLNLGSNQLSGLLPEGLFAHNPGLFELMIDRNQLTEIPESLFRHNTRLVSLSLAENSLSSLPAGVFQSQGSLQSLNLRDNLLQYPITTGAAASDSTDSELLATMGSALRHLVLARNRLTQLGDLLAPVRRLSSLGLDGNPISELSPSLFTLPQLRVISHFSLREAHLLETISPDFFDGCTIFTLALNGDRLRWLPEGVFDSLCESQRLSTLDLAGSNFSDPSLLPAGLFRKCTRLAMLGLANSRIRDLPLGFLNVSLGGGLEALVLSGNDFLAPKADWFLSSREHLRPPAHRPGALTLWQLQLGGMPQMRNISDLQRLCWSLSDPQRPVELQLDLDPALPQLLPLPDCFLRTQQSIFKPILRPAGPQVPPPVCNCHDRASGCNATHCHCYSYAHGDLCQSVDMEVQVRFSLPTQGDDSYPWLRDVGRTSQANLQFFDSFSREARRALELNYGALVFVRLGRVEQDGGGNSDEQGIQLDFKIQGRPSKYDLRTSQDIAGELLAQIQDPDSEFRRGVLGSLVDSGYWKSFDLLGATFALLAGLEVWQLVILVLALLILSLLAYLYIRRANPRANNSLIPVMFFSLADLISDVAFMLSLRDLEDLRLEFLLSLVFLVLPVLANMGFVSWTMHQERLTNSRWSLFVRQHSLTYLVSGLLSLAQTSNMRLLSSGILGAKMFSGPLSEHADYLLQLGGVAGLLLEDFPQLVLQLLVIRHQQSWEGTATVALVFTCLTLLLGLLKRVWIGVFGVDDQSEDRQWGDDDVILGGGGGGGGGDGGGKIEQQKLMRLSGGGGDETPLEPQSLADAEPVVVIPIPRDAVALEMTPQRLPVLAAVPQIRPQVAQQPPPPSQPCPVPVVVESQAPAASADGAAEPQLEQPQLPPAPVLQAAPFFVEPQAPAAAQQPPESRLEQPQLPPAPVLQAAPFSAEPQAPVAANAAQQPPSEPVPRHPRSVLM